MTTYHYVLASQKFLLEEEPFDEVIKERISNYKEKNQEIDFWLVKQPALLDYAIILRSSPAPPITITHRITTDHASQTTTRDVFQRPVY